MQVYDSVLDLIGNTPVVRVNHLNTGPCSLYIKLESQNPGGSIKDRIGLRMIEDAEKAGLISPGATLVEGTAGNTGLGLALVAAQKGYQLILVIPDKMSREKISNLKAMGARVVLTRSDVAKGHPEYYQDLAQSMANEIEVIENRNIVGFIDESAMKLRVPSLLTNLAIRQTPMLTKR